MRVGVSREELGRPAGTMQRRNRGDLCVVIRCPRLHCASQWPGSSVRSRAEKGESSPMRVTIPHARVRVPQGAASTVNPARHARPRRAACAWLRAPLGRWGLTAPLSAADQRCRDERSPATINRTPPARVEQKAIYDYGFAASVIGTESSKRMPNGSLPHSALPPSWRVSKRMSCMP